MRLHAYFQDVDVWDEAAIQTRGRLLLAHARRLWPYPTKTD